MSLVGALYTPAKVRAYLLIFEHYRIHNSLTTFTQTSNGIRVDNVFIGRASDCSHLDSGSILVAPNGDVQVLNTWTHVAGSDPGPSCPMP